MLSLRLLAVSLAALLSLAVAAQGDDDDVEPVAVTNFPDPQNVTGSVEVTNLPDVQDVHVVNQQPPAPAPASSRFQLVGFTSATYTGDMGGHFGVTQKCQLEFPGSRMCTVKEVAATIGRRSLRT